MQRGGQTWQTQAESATRVVQFERKAFKPRVRVGAGQPHQAQGLSVGAEQDVLPVVERESLNLDAPRRIRRVAGRLRIRKPGGRPH